MQYDVLNQSERKNEMQARLIRRLEMIIKSYELLLQPLLSLRSPNFLILFH
jgi:hypothetical protein